MSAICGVWHYRNREPARDDLRRVQRALEPFGRDRAQTWDGNEVALGARLFSTVPEDRLDRQPLSGGGGRFALVADLRLDNRAELAGALRLSAEEMADMADADLLLAGWERWGADVVHHLTGRFAFAVWDAAERRLFLTRDPLGLEQLYFHAGDGWFAFASRPRALLALPDVPVAPDMETLAGHMLQLPQHGPHTYFIGVSRIEPGQRGWLAQDGAWRTEAYWNPDGVTPLRLADPRDYADGLREAVTRAVSAQLRTIGPIGSMLSSGFDSSAVTVTAARLLAERGMGLHAFTHVPHPDFAGPVLRGRHADEGPLAAATAALYPNITHHRRPNPQTGQTALLDRLHAIGSCPYWGAVQLWQYDIYEHARTLGVRTVLHGSMGNFTLSYEGAEALAEMLGDGRLLNFVRHFWRRLRGDYRLPSLIGMSLFPFLPPSAWKAAQRLRGIEPWDVTDWSPIAPGLLQSPAVQERIRQAGMDYSYRPMRNGRAARIGMLRSLDIGQVIDDCQETIGIDVRDPTSDLRLIEYCLSIPTEMFSATGQTKSLYRAAFQADLPTALLEGRTRGLQIADWMMTLQRNRAEMIEDIERSAGSSSVRSMIDQGEILRLLRNLPDKDPGTAAFYRRHCVKISRGISLAHFIRRTTGENG